MCGRRRIEFDAYTEPVALLNLKPLVLADHSIIEPSAESRDIVPLWNYG